ncbi:MAG: pentapeptide repeat-containing protein [Gloeomargarita sp. SKYB31]|nr:pentapeptide repeat-containing protein [Gloeomargarita sp. SKYB31]
MEFWAFIREFFMKFLNLIVAAAVSGLVALPVRAEDAAQVRQLLHTKTCTNCDLRGADLRGARLSNANLQGSDLTRANLRGADLVGADLSNTDLRGADLRGANLSYAKLDGADLRGANLDGANLRGTELEGRRRGEFGGYPTLRQMAVPVPRR